MRILRPVMFEDNETVDAGCGGFCVLLGISPAEGIMGCGPCLEDAIQDWRKELRDRVHHADEDDELALFVKDMMAASKEDVW